MNRRDLIKNAGGALALALVSVPYLSHANSLEFAGASPDAKLNIVAAISRNHGHELNLSSESLILLLRQAHLAGSVIVSIQGQSGHSHTITLSEENLLELIFNSQLSLESSRGSGHTHQVQVSLVENNV